METAGIEELRTALGELRNKLNTDPGLAIALANKLLSKASDTDDLKLKAEIFHVTGLALHKTGQFEQAITWYTEALELRQTIGDKIGASMSLNNIGLAYHDMGQFKEAIPYYHRAIDLKQELKEFKSLTATYENLGVIYQKLSEYKNAMEVFYKSLEISEKLNDSLRVAITYQNMGVANLSWGNNLEALEMFKKALELRSGSTDQIPLIEVELNLGTALNNLKRFDEALSYYDQCLKLSEANNYRRGIMTAHNNIGEVYFQLGRNEVALQSYLKCYELASHHLDYTEQCASAINIGQIYILLNEFDQAYGYLQTALALSRQTEDRAKEREVYWCLIQVHEKKGQLAEALDCYRQYDTVKSAIINERSADDINNLKNKYELEKKEREVQQAKLLQVASELKALRAQMDPHFIFNALGSIQKELLLGNTENADRYMVRFSRLLRLILDTTRTPVVRLSDNIELLHLYIQIEQARQDNRFDYKITLGKGINPDQIFVPGLVLQPLVENAIIHGLFNKQKGKGKLTVSFAKKDGVLQITVNDNGVGRKKSGEKKRDGHKSHATAIIQETLQLIWKDKKTDDFFTIRDKVNAKEESEGTEVTVLLPLG